MHAKSTEFSLVYSKEIGQELNTEKNYIYGHDSRAACRKCHIIDQSNKPSESVEQLKYWGEYLKNQNSICEEIKSRLKSGSVCYLSV